MTYFYVFLLISLSATFGLFIGARLKKNAYHGAIIIEESENGLVYRIELAGDPEMLVFEDAVFLKVVPPDYYHLVSRGKLGV